MSTSQRQKFNWTYVLFFGLLPVAAIGGTIWLAQHNMMHHQTWYLALFFTIATGMAITAGYHRLFAHGTYKASWPIRLLFVLFGSAAMQGSVLEWSCDHRNHHRYTDTDRDPYDIKKGLWFAHLGWILTLDPSARDYSNVTDLNEDPILRFQHRYAVWCSLFSGFVLPMLIATLWHDPWGGLIIAGALRMSFVSHSTFCINSICHYFGGQTYSTQSARDNWLTAFVTFGEGFHNFHHQFPTDYRNGYKFYHFDPTKWLIWSLEKIGLASDLKRVAFNFRVKYRIMTEYQRLCEYAQHVQQAGSCFSREKLTAVYEELCHLLNEFKLASLQLEKVQRLKKRGEQLSSSLHKCKIELLATKKKLKTKISEWEYLVKPMRALGA